MATIVNNSLTAEESILRVHNPIFYVPDPTKGKPLDGFQAYFGLVGQDPLLEDQQKIVYALQENGSAVPMDQPVIGSAGGTPTLNDGFVSLAANGSYSLKILDKFGAQVYYMPHVEAVNLQGFSGVIAEEIQIVAGNLTLTFDVIETTNAGFYKSIDDTGVTFEGAYLRKGVDYVTNTSSTITMLAPISDGDVILGRQMDPTGQIIPVSSGASTLFVFQDILAAKASDLQDGDTLTINGGIASNDKLGGNRYVTVLGTPETDDGENYIDLDNGNQIQALVNDFLLARYAEKTTLVESVAGAINVDLNQGNVHKILLTENVSTINFLNINAGVSPFNTTTVTLKIRQAAGGYTVTYPASVQWAGGTAPVMTATNDAVDRYVFVSDDGGVTWDGAIMGQDFS